MTVESAYERAHKGAIQWRSSLTDHATVDAAECERFAADYAAYIDELPTLRFPDLPALTPAEYADEYRQLIPAEGTK